MPERFARIRNFYWCLVFAGLLLPSIGQAQVMVQMPLVTCAQYLAMPPEQSGGLRRLDERLVQSKNGLHLYQPPSIREKRRKCAGMVRLQSGRTRYDRSATRNRAQISEHHDNSDESIAIHCGWCRPFDGEFLQHCESTGHTRNVCADLQKLSRGASRSAGTDSRVDERLLQCCAQHADGRLR